MKSIFIGFVLFISLCIGHIEGMAQEIQVNIRQENIEIKEDSSFIRNISVLFKKSDDLTIYPVFYDYELEEISNINLYLKKGNHYKIVKDPLIEEEEVNIEYITSKRVKKIVIPPETEAKITYSISCKELMYFPNLYFFTYNDVDTLKYEISVPESFHLSYSFMFKDSLIYLASDSIKLDKLWKWNIEVVPVKVKPNPLMYFGIYKNMQVPMLRTIVVPKSYKFREKEYMNDWYIRKLESSRGLDSTTTCKIDQMTQGISDPIIIMDTLFNYVKTNFKYVAIEIGMGAFIPTHANEVFANKHGDCKDLSNFLSEALNYKGIESYVALASTFDHISNCDFPSLGSANHVICVAYINNELILLDPTDPIHLSNTPIQSIQERTILIINTKGGEFYKLKGLPAKQNEIDYELELNADSKNKTMVGSFKTNYEGISGNFLRRMFMDLNKDEVNSTGKKYYESVFGNQSISYINVYCSNQIVSAEGNLSVRGKIFNDNNRKYLFLDFLPKIMESENRETMLEGMYIGNSMDKKVTLRITMDESFEAFNPIEHVFSNEGVSLNFKISNPSDSTIKCEYEFVFDYIRIDNENLKITNEILESFKKIINEPIILKNKV